jgi:hypothetical protein
VRLEYQSAITGQANDDYGQVSEPAGVTDAIAVAADSFHSLVTARGRRARST